MDNDIGLVLMSVIGTVFGVMVVVYFERSRHAVGTECDMGGCNRRGEPTFRCFECRRVKAYYCKPCERMLIGDLRELGRQTVYCPDCAQRVIKGA